MLDRVDFRLSELRLVLVDRCRGHVDEIIIIIPLILAVSLKLAVCLAAREARRNVEELILLHLFVGCVPSELGLGIEAIL